ncbi:MAG TPA: hypothetical protein VN639_00790 [Azonexus sp.]|nr:hypothetical protein [Azonexus sp.]
MRRNSEQRVDADRRASEIGPPEGWRERRKTVERRRPEVQEIPFSEWLSHLPSKLPEETQDV